MSEAPEQISENLKKRQLDIEIMELQLKHGLVKNRAETKLQVMYYKACNAVLRARLTVHGIRGHDVKELNPPNSLVPANRNPT